MAKRICYERGGLVLGEEIGYTIRFDDKCSDKTVLRYMTDGILVRECLSDALLAKYNVVILDEAHERSLYTDVLFALLKKAVKARRGTLKLIVTSATLDTVQFAKYFEECPVIKMHGRCYPVHIKYGTSVASRRVEEAVNAAIRMHLHEGKGDILVFLTGSEECEAARKLCLHKLEELLSLGKAVPSMQLYALYGAQSSEDQSLVFEELPEDCRKVFGISL
jgi:ATP-dependent RNA helicase DHX8/PRP22